MCEPGYTFNYAHVGTYVQSAMYVCMHVSLRLSVYLSIYLPIMSNTCWGPRHVHIYRGNLTVIYTINTLV